MREVIAYEIETNEGPATSCVKCMRELGLTFTDEFTKSDFPEGDTCCDVCGKTILFDFLDGSGPKVNKEQL